MNILIKKIDVYKSTKFKGNVINQYIIYTLFDDTPINAVIANGEDEKEYHTKNIIKQYPNNNLKIIENNGK